MTKHSFLEELEKRLKALSESERQDILSEYSQYIDDKVRDGLTEEQATAAFGDLDELAKELLSAYSSDPDFKYKSMGNQVAYYFSQFAAFINDVANSIPTLSSGEIVSFLVKLFLVLVVLMVVNIPFSMASSALYHLFRILPLGIGSLINGIIRLIFDIVYGLVFIYSLYIFTKRNLIDPAADRRSFEAFKYRQRREANRNNRNNTRGGNNNMGFKSASAGDMQGAEGENKEYSENYSEDNMNNNFTAEDANSPDWSEGTEWKKNDNNSNGFNQSNNFNGSYYTEPQFRGAPPKKSFVESFVVLILQIVAVFLLLGMCVPLLGIIVVFGMSFAFVLQGFPIVGISMVLFGIMLCGLSIVVPLFSFVFRGFSK